MKRLLILAVGATFAMQAHTANATSVATDSGTANNFVTQSTSSSVASATVSNVASASASAISVTPTGGPGTITSFNTRDMQGEAAGGHSAAVGIWGQVAHTWVEGDDNGGEFDGTAIAATAGVDFKPTDETVVGVALTYESTDIDTTFNNGTFDGDGFSIGPYAAWRFHDNWSLSGLLTYGWVEYDTTNGTAATNGTFDATRFVAAANVEGAYFPQDNLRVSPRVGVLYFSEQQDDYTDNTGATIDNGNIHLGRASVGATVGYNLGMVEPYVRAAGEYDFAKEDAVALGNNQFSSDDEFGLNAGIGLNFNAGSNLSGTIEGSSSAILRENLDVYTVLGRLRYTW